MKEWRHTNEPKSTNEHTKHKPRLNIQKHTRPNRVVWTGHGSCARGKLPMYSLNARTTSTALPSFSHDQHHETEAAKRKGRGRGNSEHVTLWLGFRV